MKLKLKHLAPYLPYGLKGHVFYTEEDFELISLSQKDGVENETSINSWLTGYKCKPILRPLSDLVETPYVDLFVPNDIDDILNYYEVDGDLGHVEHYLVNMLLNYHFDIFGLIEKDLAIDINSLPQSSE